MFAMGPSASASSSTAVGNARRPPSNSPKKPPVASSSKVVYDLTSGDDSEIQLVRPPKRKERSPSSDCEIIEEKSAKHVKLDFHVFDRRGPPVASTSSVKREQSQAPRVPPRVIRDIIGENGKKRSVEVIDVSDSD